MTVHFVVDVDNACMRIIGKQKPVVMGLDLARAVSKRGLEVLSLAATVAMTSQ